jgi:phage-related protein
MVVGNLNTTNLLLGIMAAVSVLQALLLVAVGIMAWKLYGQAMEAVRGIEQRQVAPLMTRVHGVMGTVDTILGDVKGITARVGAQTERVDSAISTTIDRVDETAGRVKHSVSYRVNRVIGLISGVRAAVEHLFNGRTRVTTP